MLIFPAWRSFSCLILARFHPCSYFSDTLWFWSIIATYFSKCGSIFGLYIEQKCSWTFCRHSGKSQSTQLGPVFPQFLHQILVKFQNQGQFWNLHVLSFSKLSLILKFDQDLMEKLRKNRIQLSRLVLTLLYTDWQMAQNISKITS